MSRYFSSKYSELKPYVPGEQPRDRRYIKLNTNESPFPPSPKAQAYAAEAAKNLQLYSDPECTVIKEKMAALYGLKPSQVFFGNGSDEALYLAFLAFCDDKTPAAFPDITYGFYKVFAQFLGIPYTQIPLKEDFTIDPADYFAAGKTIFIANPNAPTGQLLSLKQIQSILEENSNNVVVIDEAYIDFGGESAVKLTEKYDNLLCVGTFSKSRSMAGARLGFAVAHEDIITDLNTIRFSTNPYNINRLTLIAGEASINDKAYFETTRKQIIENREYTVAELEKRGFRVLPSKTNFVFAAHNTASGEELYTKLKSRGILVRFFNKERLSDFLRITIGTKEQMDALLNTLDAILSERE